MGYFFFGMFLSMACGGGENKSGGGSGLLGGILATILALKGIKDAWRDLRGKKDDKNDGFEDMNTKEKISKLHELLKKKPEDLSPKEKSLLDKIQNDPEIDINEELSDKELSNLKKATGKTAEEVAEEKEKQNKLLRNKGLAIMQQELERRKDDDSDEAKQLREDYDATMKCFFNENGEELSQEEINKKLNALPKDQLERIKSNVKAISEDQKELDKAIEETSHISDSEAGAAFETAAAHRLEITKREKAKEIEKQRQDALQAAEGDADRQSEINEEYDAKIEENEKHYNKLVQEHIKKAEKIRNTTGGAQPHEETQQEKDLKRQNDKLKEEKEALSKDTAVNDQLKKYKEFKFPEGIKPGDLTSSDENKKKAAEQALKDAGLSVETYNKVQEQKSKPKDEQNYDEIKTNITEEIKERKKEIDKQIQKNNDKIAEIQSGRSQVNQTNNTGPTGTTGGTQQTNQVKKVRAAIKNFEPKEDDDEWVPIMDEDGDYTGGFAIVKKKDADGNIKYVMREGDEEAEISKEEFEQHKQNFNNFEEELNPEEEEALENELDQSYEETEEEKNSEEGQKAERDEETHKRVNPAKIWHKKKKKNGSGSTKSYYNKKGDSISPEEYHQRIENYKAYVQRHKKQQTQESLITDYLRPILLEDYKQPVGLVSYLGNCFKK